VTDAALSSERDIASPLGSRLRDRFAGIGLDEDIAEVRGQRVRPPILKR
jgi:hypothetical protein